MYVTTSDAVRQTIESKPRKIVRHTDRRHQRSNAVFDWAASYCLYFAWSWLRFDHTGTYGRLANAQLCAIASEQSPCVLPNIKYKLYLFICIISIHTYIHTIYVKLNKCFDWATTPGVELNWLALLAWWFQQEGGDLQRTLLPSWCTNVFGTQKLR